MKGSTSMRIVAIGASAGGVQALSRVMRGLPADLPAAIFVVLHIPAHSHSQLDQVLQAVTALTVTTAVDGELFERGHVYVAPPDRHLVVDAERIRLTHAPRECRVRPAVDVLFRSVAASHGPRVIGVVLTGALDDGTAGLRAIKERGGIALVQDPATAEHRSMPESACRRVDVDGVLELEDLSTEIVRRSLHAPAHEPRLGAREADGGHSVHQPRPLRWRNAGSIARA